MGDIGSIQIPHSLVITTDLVSTLRRAGALLDFRALSKETCGQTFCNGRLVLGYNAFKLQEEETHSERGLHFWCRT